MPAFHLLRLNSLACEAWILAAEEDPIGDALEQLTSQTNVAVASGSPAHDVWCLKPPHSSVSTGAARLAELATVVHGPPRPARPLTRTPLGDGDGDDLMSAANSYEQFGDRIPAADAAAAQAAWCFAATTGVGRR